MTHTCCRSLKNLARYSQPPHQRGSVEAQLSPAVAGVLSLMAESDASSPLLGAVTEAAAGDGSDAGAASGVVSGDVDGVGGPKPRGRGAGALRGRGRGKAMASLLNKTSAVIKSTKQFTGKVGADGVVLATPLFATDVVVQKRLGRVSTSSFEDPVEAEERERLRLEAERLEAERLERERLERERLEQERLEQERLERERLARRPPTPEPESDESVEPSVEGLLEAAKDGDVDQVKILLEAGTEWDGESASVSFLGDRRRRCRTRRVRVDGCLMMADFTVLSDETKGTALCCIVRARGGREGPVEAQELHDRYAGQGAC